MNNLETINLPKISKFSLTCYIVFFTLSILARFILPSGDEPDYGFHVLRVINSIDSSDNYFHPYYYVSELLQNIPTDPLCRVDSSPLQLDAYFSGSECVNELNFVLDRAILLFITTLVFVLPTTFRLIFFRIFSWLGLKISSENYSFRCDAVSIASLLPSSIYYLGVISFEQFLYCLVIASFLFFDSWLILPLLILCCITDFGNTIVFASFIASFYFINYVYNRFSFYKTVVIIISLTLFSLAFSTLALTVLQILIKPFEAISNHLGFILDSYSTSYSYVYEKYPIILRPFVTFLSFVFMTGNSVKSIFIIYILFAIIFILNSRLSLDKLILFKKSYKHISPKYLDKENSNFEYIGYIACIFYIVNNVFLFPGYGNYKYYIFFSPFFTSVTIRFYQKFHKSLLESKIIVYRIFSCTSLIVFLFMAFFFL